MLNVEEELCFSKWLSVNLENRLNELIEIQIILIHNRKLSLLLFSIHSLESQLHRQTQKNTVIY